MRNASKNGWFPARADGATCRVVKGVVRVVAYVVGAVGYVSGAKHALYRFVGVGRRRASILLLPRVVCERVCRGVVVEFPRLRGTLAANCVVGGYQDVPPSVVYETRVGKDVRLPSQPCDLGEQVDNPVGVNIVCP